MESAGTFLCVLATSNLWLAGSGVVLWLCLRMGLQLAPGTRAAASVLIVLQGWIWIGIPVELDPAWIDPQTTGILSARPAPVDGIETAPVMPSTLLRSTPSKPRRRYRLMRDWPFPRTTCRM